MRYLVAQGCELVREGGNHSWWRNPFDNRRTAIPRHQEIPDLMARKICRDLGVEDIKVH
ncbi:MAG: type II toxin-antitoxin system HicA family toxin [Magnetococcales bacterium]|nr:type II toxin-antitoxin system HicA family toxin [Magnetococcales bacterium]